MDYEAVFWDVGGVILDIDSIGRAQAVFIEDAVEHYDLPASVADARAVWRERLGEHFAGREGTRYRTARDGRKKAARALFDGDPPADWRDRYEAAMAETITLNPGVEETISRLHETGHYQGIVSDADAGLAERLANYGLAEFLDDVTTSEEVGHVKPDSRMFETAFEKAREAGVEPTNGIMVGDKYDNDMEGAKALGLSTAGYGVGEDGPAVDYHLAEIRDLLSVVGVEDA